MSTAIGGQFLMLSFGETSYNMFEIGGHGRTGFVLNLILLLFLSYLPDL